MPNNQVKESPQAGFINKITSPAVLKIFLAVTVVAAGVFVILNWTGLGGFGAAAKVNGKSISTTDFNKNVDAQQKYQKEFQKTDFSGAEGEKKLKSLKEEVLNKLIEDEVARQEADKQGIKVIQEDVNKDYENMAKANGESKFEETLSNYYGFSKEDFKKYNITPKLYRQKLQEKLTDSDEMNKEAKTKADDVLKQLKNGAKFEDMTKRYSQDAGSSQNGGDLGMVGRGQVVQELEQKAFALNEGETSDVIKTSNGYNIIKVEEKKDGKVHLRLILIKTQSFTDWLSAKVKSANVQKYVKI